MGAKAKKTKKRISDKIFGVILLSLIGVATGAHAAAPKRPQLLVGIMVEGLNDEYITLLNDYLCDGGFRRLMRDGVTIANLDYGPGVDPAAATAMVFTGAAPSVNGISGAKIYDATTRRGQNILTDPSTIGNFTGETLSPKGILVSTLGDEVRLDAAGTGWVYSAAADPVQAIIMAGHAGNSAFWINADKGNWATTTHYKDLPQTMSARNYTRPLTAAVDTMVWTPLLDASVYPDVPDYKRQYPFRHNFPRKDADRYDHFKASPKANTEITNVAVDYLNGMQFGQRGPVDMLALGYTVAPYPYTRDADNRMETLDSYLRLDRYLDRLFRTIDRRLGAGNALIFLAGCPPSTNGPRDDEKWGVPSGEFSPRKATSLLNMYLMALHGNGEWVTGYFNRNFYLNQRLIKESKLDLADVRAEAAEFLARMSGVSVVYTIDDIIASRAGDNAQALKRNTVVPHSGDVIISLTPGWCVVDDQNALTAEPQAAREAYIPSSAFILGGGVKPQIIDTPVDARVIAPTVSRLLRIRSPNAASLPALRL